MKGTETIGLRGVVRRILKALFEPPNYPPSGGGGSRYMNRPGGAGMVDRTDPSGLRRFCAVLVAMGIALAGIAAPAASANIARGEISHAVANRTGTYAHVAGLVTVEAGGSWPSEAWAGEPQLWSSGKQKNGSRLVCPLEPEEPNVLEEEPASWRLWSFGTPNPAPGVYGIENVRVRLPARWRQPCIYLVVPHSNVQCEAGWPWRLREYCPTEVVNWTEVLAVRELAVGRRRR